MQKRTDVRSGSERNTFTRRGGNRNPSILSGDEIFERVRKKAYEIYSSRDRSAGDQISDWLTAEKQVRSELRLAK